MAKRGPCGARIAARIAEATSTVHMLSAPGGCFGTRVPVQHTKRALGRGQCNTPRILSGKPTRATMTR
eukprot:3182936-Alexandrium_andersonii.AAC.1